MIGNLLSLVVLSLREPRSGLRAVLSLPLDNGGRMALFLLAAILSTLLGFLLISVTPMPPEMEAFPIGPLPLLLLQGGVLLMMSAAAYHVGRWRGGRGSFSDSIVTLSWLQIVMIAAQLAFVLLELALPFLGAILGILTLALMMWIITQFVAELHGFTSTPMVFLGVIATLLAMSLLFGAVSSFLLGV